MHSEKKRSDDCHAFAAAHDEGELVRREDHAHEQEILHHAIPRRFEAEDGIEQRLDRFIGQRPVPARIELEETH